MAWLQQEPMEPIPEEGTEDTMDWTLSPSSSAGRRTTMRKREVFTSEQVDTLVSTVPRDTVPPNWIIENEVVDPQMATSYMTESLVGPASARGTSYTYTYETHYDNPPYVDTDEERYSAVEDSTLHQTHKITRVTKVTTTRSVKQIPVESPYSDIYFDATGLPTPSPIVEIEAPLNDSEMRLENYVEEGRPAPPPAPPLGSRYVNVVEERDVPSAPGAPDIIGTGVGKVTLTWGAPLQKPDEPSVLGYQVELREFPDGDWERAHNQLIQDTTCTINNLNGCVGEVQFRVSAAGRGGFGPPSLSSVPVIPVEGTERNTTSIPLSPGRPQVIAVDGDRATIEWTAPVVGQKFPPVAGYRVEYRIYGTVNWMVANDTLTPDCCYTVENLQPNGVYEFRVRAQNADGLGAPSRSSGATHVKPATPQRGSDSRIVVPGLRPPGQPQLVEADMDWVKLDWAESEPGAGYIVEFREVGDPKWYTANQHPITVNCIHVEGLRPGSTYEFRVICVIGDSASLPSEVSDVVSLRPLWKATSTRGVPARPQPPEYLEINGDRITICWLPALSTLPVLGYDVEFRDFHQDACWYKVNEQPIHACKMTVGDLIVGHEYQFRVLAHNVVGCSEASDASPPVTIHTNAFGNAKYIEAERFGAVRLLMEEMVRESPPLPERDDSPPPLLKAKGDCNLQWRDPSLKEVIDYLDNPDREKQLNASGYLQHLTYSDNLIKDETREYGGIPKLVHLLKSDMPVIQKNACACLKNLCFGRENDKNKLAILDADGVRMLAALLQTTNDASVKEEATAALWNLSSSDMLKPVIVDAATDALVQQVSTSTLGCRSSGVSNNSDPLEHCNYPTFKNATGVLRNISAANSTARKRLRGCPNLIEGLIWFLTVAIQRNQVDSQSVENVVCLLRNLSYRIQEVEDPNYDPASAHMAYCRGSKIAPNSPKPKKDRQTKDKRKDYGNEVVTGPALMWQTHVVKLYLKLLQEASNMDTLEASAGAIQNLAACQFAPSAEHRRLPNHQQVSPASQNSERRNDNPHHEPLYASVRKGERTRDVNDSWRMSTKSAAGKTKLLERRRTRLTQKQQRELDAKMHEALRSFMFSVYEREETTRQIAFMEAARILGNESDQGLIKNEIHDENDHIMEETRYEMTEIDQQLPVTGLETPLEQCEDAAPDVLNRFGADDNELFDNKITNIRWIQREHDINANVTLEELKMVSLEELCVRMAYSSYKTSTDVENRRLYSWYKNMENKCLKALTLYEYLCPRLPLEVEQQLDKFCEVIDEDCRVEAERNARKFERRNARHWVEGGAAFECVFPVDKEDVVSNPVLLTGISGNVEQFFKICLLNGIDFDKDQKCSPGCLCFSTARSNANVLHLAAAHGNAAFITKVLFPGEAIPLDFSFRNHYKIMLERWVNGTLCISGASMLPFDVAVYYNDRECARALLAHYSYVEALRMRPYEMCTPFSNHPFRCYTESALSMATYHGNMEMVKMLQQWDLIKSHHYPQAVREAANAGDIGMLLKLWEMCGNDATCLLEARSPGRTMCSPLHIAAAAGHLRCVQFLCENKTLRTLPDAVGDLAISYAIDNGHVGVVSLLTTTFPHEIPFGAVRSAITCKRNKLAKYLFHHVSDRKEIINSVKPLKFSVEVGNFHMAEYLLRHYMKEDKVAVSPWFTDISEALAEVLCCQSLTPNKKVKFVVAFQLAGVKVQCI